MVRFYPLKELKPFFMEPFFQQACLKEKVPGNIKNTAEIIGLAESSSYWLCMLTTGAIQRYSCMYRKAEHNNLRNVLTDIFLIALTASNLLPPFLVRFSYKIAPFIQAETFN